MEKDKLKYIVSGLKIDDVADEVRDILDLYREAVIRITVWNDDGHHWSVEVELDRIMAELKVVGL